MKLEEINQQDICAVVVTYNRKTYLEKMLDRLCSIAELKSIFIVDNHSDDGTIAMLSKYGFSKNIYENKSYESRYIEKRIYLYRNSENTGGSGGFNKVIDLAMKQKHDFLWIMDDDVLPETDCLKKLLCAVDNEHLVCIPNRSDDKFDDKATVSYSFANPIILKMNRRRRVISCSKLLDEYTDVYAMPFEGPLVSTKIIKKIGLPDASYFIFYDDSDYCMRCRKYTNVRLVKSAVLHKQIIPTINSEVSWRTYYVYRNCFAFDNRYCSNYLARHLRPRILCLAQAAYSTLRKNKLKAKIIKKAYKDYKGNLMGKTVTLQNFKDFFEDEWYE